jgi:iron complex outermembrane receptor protein
VKRCTRQRATAISCGQAVDKKDCRRNKAGDEGEKMARHVLAASCCAFATVGAFLLPVSAMAQTTTTPTATATPTAMTSTKHAKIAPVTTEVVVTAQRRAERLRDVPITVTALTSASLQQANVQSLTDISKLTPGLRFDYAGPNVQPTIRGIGTTFTTSGGLGNVGIYIDGFYLPNPLAADFQTLNVQNVQVLKGPQGTLFGRNTTGGAILVTTAKPSTTPSIITEASYGSYNDRKLQTYATTGLTDKIAVDFEGLYHAGDGFIDNIYSGRKNIDQFEDFTVRLGVNVQVNDWMSWLFRYEHQSSNDPSSVAGNAYVLNGVPLTAALHPGVEALFGVPVVATNPNQVANASPVDFHAHTDSFRLTGNMDFDFATLTSYTQYETDGSYYHSDLDYSSSPLFNLGVPNGEQTITQEFLLASKPGPKLQWTTGVFYFNYIDAYPSTSFGVFGAPLAVGADSSSTTASIAYFADATYQVLPNFFITGGVRISHDMVYNAYFSTPGATGSLVQHDVPSSASDTVTPRVVLRYKPTDQTSVYFSYTKGYKPGLINVGGGTYNDLFIQPEHIEAFEVGAKYGTPRLSVDVAAYDYQYTDLQISSYNGLQSLLTNAASARIYGLEGQGDYRVTDDLDVNASFAWTDAEYTSFPTAPVYDISSPFLYNIITVPGGASGREMQRAPKVTATGGARYGFDVFGGRAAISGNVYYTSKFSLDPSDQFPQAAYTTLGLRLQWTPDSTPVTFALYGDNVTDARYRTQILPSNFGIGSVWAYPATIGFSVRYKY